MTVKAQMFRDLLEQTIEEERPAGGDYLSRAVHGKFEQNIREVLEANSLSLADVSIRDVATTFCKVDPTGRIVRPNALALALPQSRGSRRDVLEAGSPITSTAWPTVVSQLAFAEIRKPLESEDFVLTRRCKETKSDIPGTEQVPSSTQFGDETPIVLEGREVPSAQVSEVKYTLPAKDKRALKVGVTREMIRFDRTGIAVEQARQIGNSNAINREKRLADCLVGTTNNYTRNGTTYNTYLTTTWVNKLIGVALLDWTALDQMRQLFANMRDPDNGEPLMFRAKHLIPMPSKEWTAKQIVGATEVRRRTGDITQVGSNPVDGLEVFTSGLIRDRVLAGPEPVAAIADDGFFLGDLGEAIEWIYNWLLEVEEGPAIWEKQIELQIMAHDQGVAHVREPRKIARGENAAW